MCPSSWAMAAKISSSSSDCRNSRSKDRRVAVCGFEASFHGDQPLIALVDQHINPRLDQKTGSQLIDNLAKFFNAAVL